MSRPKSPTKLDPAVCTEAVEVCACANLRRVSRLVTQHFDAALAPSGLRSTQLVIMLTIASGEVASIAALARQLDMDASTLNRNLRPLSNAGWVEIDASADRRRRNVSLTAAGRRLATAAIPLWKDAQSALIEDFGQRGYEDLRNKLSRLGDIARG